MNQAHPSLDRLVDYTRGELSPREDAAIHAHLAQCADCTQAHDRELRLIEALQAHARAEERELPLGLAEAIYARAAGDRADASPWALAGWAAWLRPLAVVGAAILVLALIVSFTIPRSSAKPATIDAGTYMQNHAALASTMPFQDSAAMPVTLTADEGQ